MHLFFISNFQVRNIIDARGCNFNKAFDMWPTPLLSRLNSEMIPLKIRCSVSRAAAEARLWDLDLKSAAEGVPLNRRIQIVLTRESGT